MSDACRSLRECSILLVEDNPADVELLAEAFAERGYRANLCVARSGEEALGLVAPAARAPTTPPLPDLILIDGQLPGIPGADVYLRIRALPACARIGTFVFSGLDPTHLERLGIPRAAILRKPHDWDAYVVVVDLLLARLQEVPCAVAKAAS